MISDSLAVFSPTVSDGTISFWIYASPYIVLLVSIYFNWYFDGRKKLKHAINLQSYLIFLLRNNVEKILSQERYLRKCAETIGPRDINLTLVSSINIEDILRIPQPDVFNSLVQIKKNSATAAKEYQRLNEGINLSIKALDQMRKDYEDSRGVRLD